jgi:hypothetical protein
MSGAAGVIQLSDLTQIDSLGDDEGTCKCVVKIFHDVHHVISEV